MNKLSTFTAFITILILVAAIASVLDSYYNVPKLTSSLLSRILTTDVQMVRAYEIDKHKYLVLYKYTRNSVYNIGTFNIHDNTFVNYKPPRELKFLYDITLSEDNENILNDFDKLASFEIHSK